MSASAPWPPNPGGLAGLPRGPALQDRLDERQALDDVIETVRGGRSRALVLRGEAGVGKSVLLDYLQARAARFRLLRISGVQAERELAFAGLHQLSGPLLEYLDRLPPPQQGALRTAFGLAADGGPDRFLVGLAALSLLAESAASRPLLCVIDDAQWVDTASLNAVTFAARRMVAEPVAMVFAVRDPYSAASFDGLPQLVVQGLAAEDARALLLSALHGPADPRVIDRVVAEAHGNPLALLELPRGVAPALLASGFGLSEQRSVPASVEESFTRQLDALPSPSRRLLVVAAAEPIGDPILTWRAAARLGIGIAAAGPAQGSGLVEFGSRVQFRHPLVRSAIYRTASAAELRQAHAALAAATDPAVDPDRRVWHEAQAASGPDEEVAAALERSAARAQARGGVAAAAAFLERAVELTVEPVRRTHRAIATARAHHEAGTLQDALRLLSIAEAGRLDLLDRARVDLLRAQISFTGHRGREAPPLLLSAARHLESISIPLARETYLDALLAAMFAGEFAEPGCLLQTARSARAAPHAEGGQRPADLLLDALAVRFTDGYLAAVPLLKSALAAFSGAAVTAESLRWFWLAHITAGNLWDEHTLDNDRPLQLARDLGAMSALPLALSVRIGAHVLGGSLSDAETLVGELAAVQEATGQPAAPYGALLLAAWRGDEPRVRTLSVRAEADARRRGESFGLLVSGMASAVLANALGRYGDAVVAAMRASRLPPVMGVESWAVLAELIEAAVRTGHASLAAEAFDRLAETAEATQTNWGLGIETRSRAMLATGDDAESAYREAIDLLSRTRIRGELARAHLAYGEWLRREAGRTAARDQLRTAHGMFTEMHMEAFADRAATELRAAGETIRTRGTDSSAPLGPQESQIARLVAQGLSNAEIASRLFISPRTVEWHLSKVFAKLQITSRRQLRNVPLPDPPTSEDMDGRTTAL